MLTINLWFAMVYDTPIRTNFQSLDRVLAAGLPVLLSLETLQCAPCKALDEPLKQLARQYAGLALIVRVEDVSLGGLQERFKVARTPTLILWKDGRELGRSEGAAPKPALQQDLDFLIGKVTQPSVANGPSMVIGGPRHGGDGFSQPGWSASSASSTVADSGTPLVVTDASFDTDVINSSLPVLVDFWAPWCGPCRMVSPLVEELGRNYRGRLRVAKVNTDDNPLRASRLGIRGIPTLILFKNGREVDRIVGAAPKPTLEQFIARNI